VRPDPRRSAHETTRIQKAAVPTGVGSCRSYSCGLCESVSRIRSAHSGTRPRRERPPSIWDDRRRSSLAAYLHRRLAGRLCPDRSRDPVLLGLSPRGVCLAAPVARNAGALLPHPCTPCPKGFQDGTALCCTCRRADSLRHAFPLGSTVPCGVRTFLTAAMGLFGIVSEGATERWPDPHTTYVYCAGPEKVLVSGWLPLHAKKRSGLGGGCAFTDRASLSSRRPSRCRAPGRR